jgi:hypothetical protein
MAAHCPVQAGAHTNDLGRMLIGDRVFTSVARTGHPGNEELALFATVASGTVIRRATAANPRPDPPSSHSDSVNPLCPICPENLPGSFRV